MRRELDHLARFLHMAVAHKKSLGAKYQLLIEPKPREPTKHQCAQRGGGWNTLLRPPRPSPLPPAPILPAIA